MRQENKAGLEDLLQKLNEEALCAVPGSEEMDAIVSQIEVITKQIAAFDKMDSDDAKTEAELIVKTREVEVKEKNSHPIFDKVVKVAEVVAVPLIIVGADNFFKTKWTKMVCQWEKEETFRSSAGRQVAGNLFKFKR